MVAVAVEQVLLVSVLLLLMELVVAVQIYLLFFQVL
jgi:hypothetical protein|tara:strand:- start:152 stop:259 length:108 start_codon:yes stop_codon:yes gene_type:complete